MTQKFSDTDKQQIILAAMIAAGPAADDGQVAAQVQKAIHLLSPGSSALAAFERAEQRAEQTTQIKQFTGEVLYVDTETSSNRPVVFLHTGTDRSADGVELARLDRLDSAEGERATALAQTAASLVGHKVLVTIAVEKGRQNNVRILRGIEDRGPGTRGEITNSTGWQLVNWNLHKDGSGGLISGKLKRLPQRIAASQGAPAPQAPQAQVLQPA